MSVRRSPPNGTPTSTYPRTQAVPENVAAKVLNRAHTITVDTELKAGDEGVLVCHGSNIGGYVLFVQDGKLHYVHNYVGAEELGCRRIKPVPPGKHALSYEFEPTGPPDLRNGKGTPGIAKLFVDGELVGQAEFPVTVPLALGIGSGFAVGRNPGSSVSQMYSSPFPFTGTITKVTVDVSGKPDHDEDAVKQSQARSRHGPAIDPLRQRLSKENDCGQGIEDHQDDRGEGGRQVRETH